METNVKELEGDKCKAFYWVCIKMIDINAWYKVI